MVMTALTTERVIERFREVHGNRYDYSRVKWTGDWKAKLEIVCREHGPFYQQYATHLNKRGCRPCSYTIVRRHNSAKINQAECLRRFKGKHGDHYDYSQVIFVNAFTAVIIICPQHGPFTVIPQNHWRTSGHSCKLCNRAARKSTTTEIIKRFKAAQGKVYDYSKFEYTDMHIKGTIICRKHGPFDMTPANHLQNHGCGSCWQNTASGPELAWGTAIENELGVNLLKAQHPLGSRWGRVDFLLDSSKQEVVIEYDGRHWHSLTDSLDKDTRKSKALVALGYAVVRLREVEPGKSLLPKVPGCTNVYVSATPTSAEVAVVAEAVRRLLK